MGRAPVRRESGVDAERVNMFVQPASLRGDLPLLVLEEVEQSYLLFCKRCVDVESIDASMEFSAVRADR